MLIACLGLAGAHVGPGHEGVVFRNVGEDDEFGTAEAACRVGRGLGDAQHDVPQVADGVHVDARLARRHVDRCADPPLVCESTSGNAIG